jgi:hypothetical protein
MSVLLFTLLGYPGVGHFMVGANRLGAIIAVVFTGLTVGIVYEVFVTVRPLITMYMTGNPIMASPNWFRIGFWVIATGGVWVGAALHAFGLAKKRDRLEGETVAPL